MRADRAVGVYHNEQTGETENHPVQVVLSVIDGGSTSLYLSRTEALELNRRLTLYLQTPRT